MYVSKFTLKEHFIRLLITIIMSDGILSLCPYLVTQLYGSSISYDILSVSALYQDYPFQLKEKRKLCTSLLRHLPLSIALCI